MDKSYKLSNFTIKLLACIFMTIDHIGLLLDMYYGSIEWVTILAYIFRIIGRMAYPLFFFLAIEGARKTTNIFKYLLRLGVCLLVVGLSIIVIQFALLPSVSLGMYNIFTTLLCVVAIYYLLMRVDKWQWKLLAIIPGMILLLTTLYEFSVIYFTNDTVQKIITAFMPDYSTFTLLLLVFFFIPYCVLNYRINKTFRIIDSEKENYTDEEFNTYLEKKDYYYIGSLKSSLGISIVISCLICYLLTYIEGLTTTMYVMSTYAVLSLVFILLYNGKLGFSNKIIKYGFYSYYPLHLLVLFGLFYLISLI